MKNYKWLFAIFALPLLGLAADSMFTPGQAGQFLNMTTSTNAYQYSKSVDAKEYNGVSLRIIQGTVFGAGLTNTFKYQWSDNDSNWVDHVVLNAGTAAGGEQPYTSLIRTIVIQNATGVPDYCENVDRVKRWFRIGFKGNLTSSTGQVWAVALPMSK